MVNKIPSKATINFKVKYWNIDTTTSEIAFCWQFINWKNVNDRMQIIYVNDRMQIIYIAKCNIKILWWIKAKAFPK